MTVGVGPDDRVADTEQLRRQIQELQETLEAIRSGGIDAVIAGEPGHEKVYTLTNADRPYRVILEQMQEGASVISQHGVILSVNPRLGELLGRAAESLVGGDVGDIIVGDGKAVTQDLLALNPGQTLRGEYELIGAHGHVPVLMAASGIDLEGTTVVSVVVTDLTAQKEVEDSLRQSEQRLSRILDALPVGVYISDQFGRSLYANRQALLLAQLPRMPTTVDEVKQSLRLFSSADGQPYPESMMPIERAQRGEAVHGTDVELRQRSGDTLAVEFWTTPVRSGGAVEFVILTTADVTERKRNEQVIADQAQMLELAHDAVIVWGADNRITYWNTGAERTYGYTKDEAVGSVIHDLLQTTFPRPLEDLKQIVRRDGHWEGELEQRRADGSRVVVDSRWAPHNGPDGHVAGTMEVNRDVTERKEAQEVLAERAAQLELANRDIRRSNEDLEQFAYVASHDLSEPLRAIELPLSMLQRRYEGQLGPDADEYIGFAIDGCKRMQKMIDDLLRWSRVGRIEEKFGQVDCGAAVSDVLLDLQEAIRDGHAIVDVGSLPTVWGSRSQLMQVFQNLLSNALKFVAPGGAPHIEVAATRDGDYWRFTVSDNGIGIDERQRERIFGMFKRLHPRDEYPGTGIGLALARKSVERHGGAIGVEDAPSGQGSQFWFTIPIGPRASG